MRILYVFPHPDDESFGPGPVIHRQTREGQRVALLTLTRGGATRQRERLGLSIEEMGNVRADELRAAADVLGVESLEVLDLPDGGLKWEDPLELEAIIRARVERFRPDVLVTYAVHGISGHPDHLVAHAVVKRLFCALRRRGAHDEGARPRAEPPPRRLALFTLVAEQVAEHLDLGTSEEDEVGCVVEVAEEDMAAGREALARYETYREVIERHRPLEHVGRRVRFELFGERPDPPLGEMTAELPEASGRGGRSGAAGSTAQPGKGSDP